jgi:hydrogenase nickel incorporation protein HypA/HybF
VHELSLASAIYRTCRSRLPGDGDQRLECVRVAIGELSSIEPELLRYAWDAVIAGQPDEGAVLEIDWQTATQRCEACGTAPARTGGSWWPCCPRCGRILRIEGGDALDVIEFSCSPLTLSGSVSS